jgi:universal stress protein A
VPTPTLDQASNQSSYGHRTIGVAASVRGPLLRSQHGSVALGALTPSRRSAAQAAPQDAAPIQIRRILCPVDLSACSRSAFQYAKALADWFDATLVALHVGSSVMLYEALVARVEPTAVACPTRAERTKSVRRFIEPFVDGRAHIEISLEEGDVPTAITDTAARLAADLIVMATHGRGGLRHLIRGSVTEYVHRASRCPVFIVPPGPAPTVVVPGFARIICLVGPTPAAGAREYVPLFARNAATVAHELPSLEAGRGLVGDAADPRPDLIVMSATDPAADQVIRRAMCPVLIVPPHVMER